MRRIRGAIGVGVSWAVLWGLVGGVLEAVFGLPPGWSGAGVVLQEFARGFSFFATIGFLGSGVFSAALALGGRARSFADMSLPRFATWGALAGSVVGMAVYAPLLLTPPVRFSVAEMLLRAAMSVGVLAAVGAASAAGSLALARKADDRELLATDEELAGIGLTRQEKRELLGA